MIRKALIAAAALASVAAFSASQASAKVHVNIGLGFPGYGYGYVDPYPVYPVYDSYDDGYGDDCHYKIVKKKKWSNKYHTYITFKKKVLVCY